MLSCNINLAGTYGTLAPQFTAGLEWLSQTDISSLNAGCVLLNTGDFIIVAPGEAHMAKCAVNGPEKVRKAVIKVKA